MQVRHPGASGLDEFIKGFNALQMVARWALGWSGVAPKMLVLRSYLLKADAGSEASGYGERKMDSFVQ